MFSYSLHSFFFVLNFKHLAIFIQLQYSFDPISYLKKMMDTNAFDLGNN